MGVTGDNGKPPNRGEALDDAPSELDYRLKQQRILAELGALALKTSNIDSLLGQACTLASRGMSAPMTKILCHDDDSDELLLVAGTGWEPGVVGKVRLPADRSSPCGCAFKTGDSVISDNLLAEDRFGVPQFMQRHGVRSAINVVIEGEKRRYGVLEVDSRDVGKFKKTDLPFMAGFASMLGVALDRSHVESRLKHAVSHQELLTREASHRVKNSLSMVVALLSLQMKQTKNPEARRLLADAQSRIATITEAHDQLWKSNQPGIVDVGALLERLASILGEQAPGHRIMCQAETQPINADTAISIGLLITELATNAIKYAYKDGGEILITLVRQGSTLKATVADHGIGLPHGFDMARSGASSLGMRMIRSLSRQIGARVSFDDNGPGTRVTLTVPLSDD